MVLLLKWFKGKKIQSFVVLNVESTTYQDNFHDRSWILPCCSQVRCIRLRTLACTDYQTTERNNKLQKLRSSSLLWICLFDSFRFFMIGLLSVSNDNHVFLKYFDNMCLFVWGLIFEIFNLFKTRLSFPSKMKLLYYELKKTYKTSFL